MNQIKTIIKSIYYKLKNDIVLSVSFLLALISVFIVKADVNDYVNYINYSVIVLLFCFMVSVAGLSKCGFLNKISNLVLKKVKNTRIAALLIIIITFFASMLITNDVALITFVPICLILFKEANNQSQLIKVITFQTIAANMGSILTPFGNPQNLFLYTYYNVSFFDFLKITLFPTLIGFAMLLFSVFFIVPKTTENKSKRPVIYSKKKTLFYGMMFFLSLVPIFHIWHYLISLILISICVFFFEKSLFKKIDYSLLFTFVCFFIFIGNMQKLPGLTNTLSAFLSSKSNVYISSVSISQFISNVPAAILLSGFTKNFKELILGVNVGGLGTLIASLANLISYNFFKNFRKSSKNNYLIYFLCVNLLFLVINFIIVYFIFIKL